MCAYSSASARCDQQPERPDERVQTRPRLSRPRMIADVARVASNQTCERHCAGSRHQERKPEERRPPQRAERPQDIHQQVEDDDPGSETKTKRLRKGKGLKVAAMEGDDRRIVVAIRKWPNKFTRRSAFWRGVGRRFRCRR
jgi:hypothetical protein